jgi:Na+-transporting NADH:ubiquinone oxidoreductase subunit F
VSDTIRHAKRDYSLTGPERERAQALGLVEAAWFQPEIEPAMLRRLQARSNGRAARDTVLWLVLLVASGVTAFVLLPSWWAVLPLLVYAALYGGSADARWHEHGHGTAFANTTANEVIYHLACFMLWRGPTTWRWSHYRHHTDTIVVGRDPEILFERPSNAWRAAFAFSHLQGGPLMGWRLVKNAFGSLDDGIRDFVPENELRKVVWEARLFVAITAGVVAWAIAIQSILPLLFFGLPTIYGAWLMVFFGITQHAGMREDVLDHRLNTRSVRMNPVLRFLYLNMNYHVEHHIYPSVPYHALPGLHTAIADQLAPIKPNVASAYREIFSTLWKQQHDHSYEIPLDLPPTRAKAARIDMEGEPLGSPDHEKTWDPSGMKRSEATYPIASPGETAFFHSPAESNTDGRFDLGGAIGMTRGALRRIDIAAGDNRPAATYVLCRLDDGSLTLADGYCTHQQFHLCGGALIDGEIECPKHNARFDARTGAPTRRPARTPLVVYAVDEVDGRVVSTLQPLDASLTTVPTNSTSVESSEISE